jgi:transposase-like protein
MTDHKTRHSFTAAQKAQAVRQHLLGKIPISDLAEQLDTQPRQIHLWIEQVLAQAEKALQYGATTATKRADDAKDLKIARLEEKLVKKNEVVAELMEAHVQLKKELGDL